MLASRTFDIDAALAPARRALGRATCARLMLHGLIGGVGVGVADLALARVWPFTGSLAIALVAVVAGPIVGVAVALTRWPDTQRAARMADRHFVLGDRLTTALEFKQSMDPLMVLQRADTARSVRGLPLHRAAASPPRWRERGMAVLGIALLVALANTDRARPIAVAGSTGPYLRHRIAQAGAMSVPEISRSIERSLREDDRKDPSLASLRLQLLRLQHQLQASTTLNQALRAISLTQQQMHQLDASLHPLNSSEIAQLNLSLGRYLSPLGAGSVRNERDANGTAQSLSRLAASLNRLRAAQRQDLARALARAANRTSDVRLRSSLRQAASALSRTDTASAAIFLRHGATLLNETSRALRARARIRASSARLDKLKNAVSGIHRRPGVRPTPGATGKNAKSASQKSGSNSRSADKGEKKQGSSQFLKIWKPTNERSAAKDQRVVANVRRAGQGGRVNDDPLYASQKNRKARAIVVLHGHAGKGTLLLQNGPRGSLNAGSQVQYRRLVLRYAQTARAALNRGSLPPSVQGYVKQYFNEISR
ncbi:MAG: hypothetical protein PVSMB7_11800 [Chloroflexota bacterium]